MRADARRPKRVGTVAVAHSFAASQVDRGRRRLSGPRAGRPAPSDGYAGPAGRRACRRPAAGHRNRRRLEGGDGRERGLSARSRPPRMRRFGVSAASPRRATTPRRRAEDEASRHVHGRSRTANRASFSSPSRCRDGSGRSTSPARRWAWWLRRRSCLSRRRRSRCRRRGRRSSFRNAKAVAGGGS